ncbi:MAG TPA: hypothetical protein VGJ13_16895 [Pseudonocardiaceae bacterium]
MEFIEMLADTFNPPILEPRIRLVVETIAAPPLSLGGRTFNRGILKLSSITIDSSYANLQSLLGVLDLLPQTAIAITQRLQ